MRYVIVDASRNHGIDEVDVMTFLPYLSLDGVVKLLYVSSCTSGHPMLRALHALQVD